MNRAERRALAKAQRNMAIRQNMESVKKKEANRAIVFQNRMYLAATVLALHREFGFGRTRCLKALHAIEDIAFNASCAEELRQNAVAETGIDIPAETEDFSG